VSLLQATVIPALPSKVHIHQHAIILIMMFPGLDIRIPPMTACGLIIQRVEFMNLAHIPMFVHVKKKSVSCTSHHPK
jgi:hypothetical protein